ncbi:MAG: hypothetical protein OXK79_06120 [Chloroflexota bacterium]|nr:hypothetical protein [Chloroflexota bacterium]
MRPTIFIRSTIVVVATLALLVAVACGSDSEPSTEPQTSDTTSTTSPPAAPPPAAVPAPTSAPDPTAAPAPSEETVNVGHRVGDRAPDYMLALTGDRQVNSADLVAEGKPVFILFHATW